MKRHFICTHESPMVSIGAVQGSVAMANVAGMKNQLLFPLPFGEINDLLDFDLGQIEEVHLGDCPTVRSKRIKTSAEYADDTLWSAQ